MGDILEWSSLPHRPPPRHLLALRSPANGESRSRDEVLLVVEVMKGKESHFFFFFVWERCREGKGEWGEVLLFIEGFGIWDFLEGNWGRGSERTRNVLFGISCVEGDLKFVEMDGYRAADLPSADRDRWRGRMANRTDTWWYRCGFGKIGTTNKRSVNGSGFGFRVDACLTRFTNRPA